MISPDWAAMRGHLCLSIRRIGARPALFQPQTGVYYDLLLPLFIILLDSILTPAGVA